MPWDYSPNPTFPMIDAPMPRIMVLGEDWNPAWIVIGQSAGPTNTGGRYVFVVNPYAGQTPYPGNNPVYVFVPPTAPYASWSTGAVPSPTAPASTPPAGDIAPGAYAGYVQAGIVASWLIGYLLPNGNYQPGTPEYPNYYGDTGLTAFTTPASIASAPPNYGTPADAPYLGAAGAVFLFGDTEDFLGGGSLYTPGEAYFLFLPYVDADPATGIYITPAGLFGCSDLIFGPSMNARLVYDGGPFPGFNSAGIPAGANDGVLSLQPGLDTIDATAQLSVYFGYVPEVPYYPGSQIFLPKPLSRATITSCVMQRYYNDSQPPVVYQKDIGALGYNALAPVASPGYPDGIPYLQTTGLPFVQSRSYSITYYEPLVGDMITVTDTVPYTRHTANPDGSTTALMISLIVYLPNSAPVQGYPQVTIAPNSDGQGGAVITRPCYSLNIGVGVSQSTTSPPTTLPAGDYAFGLSLDASLPAGGGVPKIVLGMSPQTVSYDSTGNIVYTPKPSLISVSQDAGASFPPGTDCGGVTSFAQATAAIPFLSNLFFLPSGRIVASALVWCRVTDDSSGLTGWRAAADGWLQNNDWYRIEGRAHGTGGKDAGDAYLRCMTTPVNSAVESYKSRDGEAWEGDPDAPVYPAIRPVGVCSSLGGITLAQNCTSLSRFVKDQEPLRRNNSATSTLISLDGECVYLAQHTAIGTGGAGVTLFPVRADLATQPGIVVKDASGMPFTIWPYPNDPRIPFTLGFLGGCSYNGRIVLVCQDQPGVVSVYVSENSGASFQRTLTSSDFLASWQPGSISAP